MTRHNAAVSPILLISALSSSRLSFSLSAQQAGSVIAEGQVTVGEIQSKLSNAFAAIGKYSVQERNAALDLARRSLGPVDQEIDLLEQRVRENWHEIAREETSQAKRTLREHATGLEKSMAR